MARRSPLGAFCAGLAAGFAGALAQNLFFACTKNIAPAPAPGAFAPAEPEQAAELPTQTVARRVVEQVVRRGPLQRKNAAGQVVHLAFGAAWGAAYGLVAGSWPRPASAADGAKFGLLVWAASDNLLLPAVRLSAWPHHYPAKTHAYAIAAHAVYGVVVAGTFWGLGRVSMPATAALGSYWLTRRVPRLLRRPARRLAYRGLRVALPARAAVAALG